MLPKIIFTRKQSERAYEESLKELHQLKSVEKEWVEGKRHLSEYERKLLYRKINNALQMINAHLYVYEKDPKGVRNFIRWTLGG